MKEVGKILPVVVILSASVATFAQAHSGGTEAKSSSSRMMVIDPKVRDQMMATTDQMDKQLQELKARVARQATPASEREALDAQIQALQKSVRELKEQTEMGPHYLDQEDPLLP